MAAQDGLAPAEHRMREGGEIRCRRKQTGVAGDPLHHAGVFVLNFALDDAPAECPIVRSGRDLRSPRLRRGERGTCHAKGAKNFTLAKPVERLLGDPFESETEQEDRKSTRLNSS